MTGYNSYPFQEPDRNHPAGSKFFEWIRGLNIYRPTDRWIAGVCSALANKLGWDPIVVRVLLLAFCITGGGGVLLYGLLWLFLPDARDNRILAEEALFHGNLETSFWWALVLVIISGGFNFILPHSWIGTIILVCIVCAIIASTRSKTPKQPGPRPGRPGPQGPFPADNPGTGPQTYAQQPHVYRDYHYVQNGPIPMNPTQPIPPIPQTPPSATPLRPPAGTSVWGPATVYRRRPAGPVTVSIVLGLILIGAGITCYTLFIKRVDFFGCTQAAVLFLSAATALVALATVITGIRGRKSGGLIPLGILVSLSLIVSCALGAVTASDFTDVQALNDPIVFSNSDSTLTSDNFSDYAKKGLEIYNSNIKIDLKDWKKYHSTPCPTGSLTIHASFSRVTVTVPSSCRAQYGKSLFVGTANEHMGTLYSTKNKLKKSQLLTINAAIFFSTMTISPTPAYKTSNGTSSIPDEDSTKEEDND